MFFGKLRLETVHLSTLTREHALNFTIVIVMYVVDGYCDLWRSRLIAHTLGTYPKDTTCEIKNMPTNFIRDMTNIMISLNGRPK